MTLDKLAQRVRLGISEWVAIATLLLSGAGSFCAAVSWAIDTAQKFERRTFEIRAGLDQVHSVARDLLAKLDATRTDVSDLRARLRMVERQMAVPALPPDQAALGGANRAE